MKQIKKKQSRLGKALIETAGDMKKAKLLSAAACEKITMRHLNASPKSKPSPLNARTIRTLRARAQMSQAVFAYHLNVTPGYISQLERGEKQPTGAALALLNVIHNKGIEVML